MENMMGIDQWYLQHRRDITVAVNDADFCGRIKPGAVMEYFQDIATEHADILGLGAGELLAQNLAWVMIRMSFKIFSSPVIGEELTVVTIPEKPKALDVNRSYYIYNKTGETVITGSSKWCVLDMNTHRIQRCTRLFERFGEGVFYTAQPFDDANLKIEALSRVSEVGKRDEAGVQSKPDGADGADAADKPDGLVEGPFGFTVRVTDLDQNFHMNNARYGDALLNVCGVDMLREKCLSRVDVNFISELFINDRYDVYKVHKDNITLIEARKADGVSVGNGVSGGNRAGSGNRASGGDGAAVFRARAVWL
jgi:acyl-ACP thioesterase